MTNIWVLTDHRAGNTNQALGLADAIGQNYGIKKLYYNLLACLPNWVLGASSIHIKDSQSADIKNGCPDLIISSGRRTATVALKIKLRCPDAKVVQIMKPDMDPNLFDLILLPQHDQFEDKAGNVLRTIGAINRLNKESLAEHLASFSMHYPQKHLCTIGVLVGGNNKNFKFTKEIAYEFASIIEYLSTIHGAQVFISFSRRTPELVKKIFRESFPGPHIIYDPKEGGYNPYMGLLSIADYMISTADSISMCSEVASSGKPLYIYIPEGFASAKHKYFAQQLFDLGVARPLESDIFKLEKYNCLPLKEGQKAAQYILNNLLKDKH